MAGRPPKRIVNPPNRIRALREERGMTLEQLAGEIGVTDEAVRQYETGINQITVYQLERIARVFKVSACELLRGYDGGRTDKERAMLSVFRDLASDDRERVLKMAMALLPADRKARTGSE